MRHRIFTIVAGLSLAICALTIFMWIWSVNGEHHAQISDKRWSYVGVTSNRGEVAIEIVLDYPHWVFVLLTAIMPLAWLIMKLRRRPQLAHACASCGYDLRATPDCCPECGSIPAAR